MAYDFLIINPLNLVLFILIIILTIFIVSRFFAPKVRMPPYYAKEIYESIHDDLKKAEECLKNFNEEKRLKYWKTLESKGTFRLLDKKFYKKFKSFCDSYNNEYLNYIQLVEAKKIADMYNVTESNTPNRDGFLKTFFLGTTHETSISAFNRDKPGFIKEMNKTVEDYKNKRDLLLKELIDDLFPELSMRFSQDLMAEEERRNFHTILNIAAFVSLTSLLILVTYWNADNAKKLTDATIEQFRPKVEVELVSSEITAGHFVENFTHPISSEQELKSGYLKIPVYIRIHNYGTVPVQLYNVAFESRCDGDSGRLPLPPDINKEVKSGESLFINSSVQISSNTNVSDLLPCEIGFIIKGPNFIANKRLLLTKPPTIYAYAGGFS